MNVTESDQLDYNSSGTIEIPLKSGDEVIEIDFDQLPLVDDILNILSQELPPLSCWINIALAYYRKKLVSDFERVLEEARLIYKDLKPYTQDDVAQLLDMLANYYGRKSSKANDKDARSSLLAKATTLFTSTDGIALYDQKHLLRRAFHFIYEGENWTQADSQLNFVLNQGLPNVPAFLGKACIAFNKKEYRNALGFYRRALRLQSTCPATVRLGIGHCFFKLNNMIKARLAFERVLELDPICVGAIIGLAILDLNEKTQDSIKSGIQKLSRAYNLDSSNPMVLNHLVDHFFYKKEYRKVHTLAYHAYQNTDNEAMKAESCYQIARAYHVEEDFDKAFQYYYSATQLASPGFILPFYGLGQMYLHRNDQEHAAIAFEKVLRAYPDNYETLKILGRLYAQSNNQEKLKQARDLFKKVTEIQPDDVEAWIEYAQLSNNDSHKALEAYMKAVTTLEDNCLDITPEVLNNIGVLHFLKNNFKKSLEFFQRALERIKDEGVSTELISNQLTLEELSDPLRISLRLGIECMCDQTKKGSNDYYLHGLAITVNYNTGRLFEEMNRTDLAVEMYRKILLSHPTYLDCFLRLGRIAQENGQFRNAAIFFNEALEIRPENPDARSFLALLHMSQNDIDTAQKKFNMILAQPEFRADSFARIGLGNIWLNSLHHTLRDRERRLRHLDRALSNYKAVLSADPKNIWAAHGVGCVLAHKGHINEARDVFAQVREATAELTDVWINIAHIYVEQKQFIPAVQMYENCMKKFNLQTDTELLLYLARAHFKATNLKECKAILLTARHCRPWDSILTYNLALVQKRLAVTTLQDETSSFSAVYEAIADLSMARWTFENLNNQPDLACQQMAGDETKICQDLLSQAKYHLTRAKSREELERIVKQRQEMEREASKRRQQELQEITNKIRMDREKHLEEQRGKFIEKAKQIITEPSIIEPKKSKCVTTKKKSRLGEFIDDVDEHSSGGGASSELRNKITSTRQRDAGLSSKQRLRVVSKATVESSGESSEENIQHEDQVIFSSDDEPMSKKSRLEQVIEEQFSSELSSSVSIGSKFPGYKKKKQLNKRMKKRKVYSNSLNFIDDSTNKLMYRARGKISHTVSDSSSNSSGAYRRRALLAFSDEDVEQTHKIKNSLYLPELSEENVSTRGSD